MYGIRKGSAASFNLNKRFKICMVGMMLAASTPLMAGTMGCTALNVSTPCDYSGWEVSGQALYLKPGYSNLAYSGVIIVSPGAEQVYEQPNYSWDWGFKIQAGYRFATGNDITVNWYHFNSSGTRRFSSLADREGRTFLNTTTVGVDPHWDAVNLQLGQSLLLSPNFTLHYHGGLQFARIETTDTILTTGAIFQNTTVPGTVYLVSTHRFNGVGPRLGVDGNYDWGNGFYFYGNGAATLLAGTNQSNLTNTPALAGLNGLSTTKSAVVPALDLKLGAGYTYLMAAGNLSADVGWMWVNYFHAQIEGNANAVISSNFSLQGPYVGLKWEGNLI